MSLADVELKSWELRDIIKMKSKPTQTKIVWPANVELRSWELGDIILNQLNHDSNMSKHGFQQYIREKRKKMEIKEKQNESKRTNQHAFMNTPLFIFFLQCIHEFNLFYKIFD